MNLINKSADCVDEFLDGLVTSNSGLLRLPGHRVVLRKDLSAVRNKVALLSGGGSGHEPAFGGYVGQGMLTGSISGSVFTSPPPASILAAIRSVVRCGGATGVILIVLNYTGDRVNFGLAKERAQEEGMKVSMVVIGEDCALVSADRTAGRRGLAGIVLLIKIAGAMAELGRTMDEMENTLNSVCQSLGTIGVCMKPCILPGSDSPSFDLPPAEYELGLGIHGEAGVRRLRISTSRAVVQSMFDHMTNEDSTSHLKLEKKDDVVVLVNNLGSTSTLEMGVVVKNLLECLQEKRVNVLRVYVGSYLTSLQMYGISLTVLNLNLLENVDKSSILDCLDFPTNVVTPLTGVRCNEMNGSTLPKDFDLESTTPTKGIKVSSETSEKLRISLKAAANELLGIRDLLNTYDSGAGDGDCGDTHGRLATAVLEKLNSREGFCDYPAVMLKEIGDICHSDMGGTSGAMCGLLFDAMSNALNKCDNFTSRVVGSALKNGVAVVMKYGRAKTGDRTMLDVLEPLANYLVEDDLKDAKSVSDNICALVKDKASDTKNMTAKAGRASYVSADMLKYPDPGAAAVAHVSSTFASHFYAT